MTTFHTEPSLHPNMRTVQPGTQRRVSALTCAVGIAAMIWALGIASLAIAQHRNYGSWGFDFGIYDQVWWLIGRDGVSSSSFISMRGMPVWGHHVNAVFLLLAPFARLGMSAEFLIVVQAVVLAAGALPVAWLGRTRSGSAGLGGACAAAYLLHPALGWLGWVSFHPEALAVTPLLFAVWFARTRRYGRLALCIGLALSCREDAGLIVAMLGVALMIGAAVARFRSGPHRGVRSDAVAGLVTFASGLGWFFVCSRWLIPTALGRDVYYIDRFYARFGTTMSEVAVHLATHPGTMASLTAEPQSRTYLLDLFLPLGGLPLLGISSLSALPQMVAAIAADSPYVRDIRFQYTALMLPGLMLATVEVLAGAWRRRRAVGRVLLGWVLLCSVSAAFVRGPLPGSLAAWNWKLAEPARATLDRAVAMVPSDARVAAADNIAPHLSHRRALYDFPNPFGWMIYGSSQADAAKPTDVDWVLLQPDQLSDRHRVVLNEVRASGAFDTVLDEDGVLLLRRR